ncbi:MAG: hypothetical protein N2Z62_10400 [Rhodobacteraceae bacterium]|nr:hypothetical protein [Paracoccaceae bacterium]
MRRSASTFPPADRWHDLLMRALDGLLPPELPLERLLDRLERPAGDAQ